jgi:hypothetical protein
MKVPETLKYQKIPIDIMNHQINLRLPGNLLTSAREYAKKNGFASIQEFIKETLREKLFTTDEFSPEEVKAIVAHAEYCKKNNLFLSVEETKKALGMK